VQKRQTALPHVTPVTFLSAARMDQSQCECGQR